jgi:3-oxoacyl-[acyl-carrier protein] reductase
MELGIEGRHALVTGGSLGIGRQTAAGLAAAGVDVAIVARDAARLADVAGELDEANSGRVVAIPGDMSKPDDIERVIAGAREALGAIDILVNNAGSSPAGRIGDLEDDIWITAFGLKFMGYMRCARAVLPEMRSRRWGRVVNVIGRGGHNPSAGYILGGSFNAALLNFTRALAYDCAPDNITVNGVNPGATDTPRWQQLVAQKSAFTNMTQEAIQAESVADIPAGRIGRPEDIADMIVFLCSERASYVNGAFLNVDGASTDGL